tara:strand:+ start:23010 stop:23168 length:159 start_codon:yes stop_codon:yes gene_type:complete
MADMNEVELPSGAMLGFGDFCAVPESMYVIGAAGPLDLFLLDVIFGAGLAFG